MNICDICKKPSAYNCWATTKPNGEGKNLDLCGRCYDLLHAKERKYAFLAYQETTVEVTDKQTNETWLQRLKFMR